MYCNCYMPWGFGCTAVYHQYHRLFILISSSTASCQPFSPSSSFLSVFLVPLVVINGVRGRWRRRECLLRKSTSPLSPLQQQQQQQHPLVEITIGGWKGISLNALAAAAMIWEEVEQGGRVRRRVECCVRHHGVPKLHVAST